ncbi:MAG TPA: MBL fold metallo-hydrolase [Parvibaculum sp.]|jgi:ribonuclease BN (tRNA processing enzyme)
MKFSSIGTGLAALGLVLLPAQASAGDAPKSVYVTLGTNSGPIPNPQRAEPANFLHYGDQNILVDAGDAASWQLAKVGVDVGQVQTVIISHLHFDHTSGLYAFLSLRYQEFITDPVTIYGPPGIKRVVDSLMAGMAPNNETPSGLWSWMRTSPEKIYTVVEIGDGATFSVGKIKVTAAENSHYSFAPGSEEAKKYVSLSYRFDAPDRSIVFTGDTGPSAAVEKLARNADLLVSEIMDPDVALKKIEEKRYIPFFAESAVKSHFSKEHLSPTEVGLLASRAHVKALVLTHDALPDEAIPQAGKEIAANYKGSVVFAKDLDKF